MIRNDLRDILGTINKSYGLAIQERTLLQFIKENMEKVFHEIDEKERNFESNLQKELIDWKFSLMEGEFVTKSSLQTLEWRVMDLMRGKNGNKN